MWSKSSKPCAGFAIEKLPTTDYEDYPEFDPHPFMFRCFGESNKTSSTGGAGKSHTFLK